MFGDLDGIKSARFRSVSRSVCDTLDRPLGRYVGSSVSCHTTSGLVWSCSRCNSIENAVMGICNIVSVVELILNI